MLLTIPPDKEYFSIGDVSRLSGVKPHVLRYWERAFGLVRPARRGTGHRRFGRRDVETIGRIRELVEDRRYDRERSEGEHLRRLADQLLEGVPWWGVMKTTVTPLQAFAQRAANDRALLARIQAM